MTLQDRIENWRRWVLTGSIRYRQAESLEGSYRSPQHWHPETPRGAEIMVADAQLLERAWASMEGLPKMLILWHHVYRLEGWKMRRRVRKQVSVSMTDRELPEAIAMAEAIFAGAIGLVLFAADDRASADKGPKTP